MEGSFLFINRSDESSAHDEKFRERLNYSDKETLLQAIDSLLENNRVLRRYIELLEKKGQ